METYQQMYDKAKKAKSLKTLTPTYHDWKSDSSTLVGAYVSHAPVEGSMGGKSYNQYIFDTDIGLVKFSLGSAADNEIAAILNPGVIYHIEYAGKEEIKGGRQVNKFNIVELGTAEFIPIPDAKTKSDDSKVNQE